MTTSSFPFSHPAHLETFFVASEHSYFGQDRGVGPREVEQSFPKQIEIVAGKGIVGDRFFDVAPTYSHQTEFDGQVTFLSHEVLALASEEHPSIGVETLRRNIVVSGVNLNVLIGTTFAVVSGDTRIRFEATKTCSPCRWLDEAGAPGLFAFFRGRGGIRTRVLDSGVLTLGEITVESSQEFLDRDITDPLSKPRLP